MAEQPVQDIGTRLRALRRDKGMSLEDLGFEARKHGPAKITFTYVGMIERGERYPTPQILETIANGLGVPAETFPEYRLAKVRELFDERVVGLEEALSSLEELRAVLGEGALPAPPRGGALEQLLSNGSPSETSPDQSQTRPPRAPRRAAKADRRKTS